MKKFLICLLSPVLFFFIIYSCQRELSFENGQAAAGSLKRDTNGDCAPITVAGTYVTGKPLGDTNYLEVEVNVKSPGHYKIKTDTVNGYSFSITGNFANAGSIRVKLPGSGKPQPAGSNIFTVKFDSSSCHVTVLVRDSSTAVKPAAFTLQGAPNACMNASLSGSFVKGIALDTSSKVSVGLNVTTPGTYSIATNTINGYSFSGSGTLLAAGTQAVSLIASGTPLNVGINVFTVTAGASTCTFSDTVLQAISVTNNDHFPLTGNSHWFYDDLFHAGDSLKRRIADTLTISGNRYTIMEEQPTFGSPVQYFFRKSGNDYFEYGSVDKYTASLTFSPSLNAEIPVLKENLITGDAWQSPEYTATASFGQILTIQYRYYCADANATVTINGKAFTNVYKITMRPQIKAVGYPYGDTNEIYSCLYAKGVGLIYVRRTGISGFLQPPYYQIKSWLVN